MKTREQLLSDAYELLLKFEEKILPELPKYREGWRYQNLLKTIVDLKNDNFIKEYDIDGMYPFVGDEIEGEVLRLAHSLASDLTTYLIYKK